MKKIFLSVLFLSTYFISTAQSTDEKAVLDLLTLQTKAWNAGNLEEFMTAYWNNDSLMFIGKKSVIYGYQNTLNTYKKSFPDAAAMGTLNFDILHTQQLSPQDYFVLGKYTVNRKKGEHQGHFTLLFRKINGKWLIVSDHSS